MELLIEPKTLLEWCSVPHTELAGHPQRKVGFRLCADSAAMGQIMARELVDEIKLANAERRGRSARSSPAGRASGTRRSPELVNRERVSLRGPDRLPHGRVPGLAGARAAAEAPLQLPRLHGAALLRPDRRRAGRCRRSNRVWLDGQNVEQVREAHLGGAGRPHLWRLGTGRPHRLQPGPPASVQPRRRWTTCATRRSAYRTTTWTRSWPWRSALSAPRTSSCRRCR